jgi:hypothetical protein
LSTLLLLYCSATNGGLLVTPATVHHDTIIQLALTHRLPSIFSNRADAVAGGLMAYGSDLADRYRRAAGYVAAAQLRTRQSNANDIANGHLNCLHGERRCGRRD